MPDYDYCIMGAGCAGLSLLMRMLAEPALQGKKILLVDKDAKTANDRTWCFWEKGDGFFEDVVHHEWSKLWFHGTNGSRLLDAGPYRYKMIRGADFYQYCFTRIRSAENVEFIHGNIDSVHSDDQSAFALIDGRKITAGRIFNSIPFSSPSAGRHWRLLQHFKGWVIRSLQPAFDPREATIMDFRTSQQEGTCFFYVMPLSPTKALVECTFFSACTLPESVYTDLLIRHIRQVLKIKDYVIMERELGVIPMTTARFPVKDHFIRNIGAAAGLTKPSTGYTFQFIQEDATKIVDALVQKGDSLPEVSSSRRHQLYDKILLNVLVSGKLSGDKVFSSIFTGASASDLFAFLDNASSRRQDLAIIRTLPKGPFLRAAGEELLYGFLSRGLFKRKARVPDAH